METASKSISRRDFIKLSGVTGAALTLGFYFPAAGKDAEIIKAETAESLGTELNAFISIDPSGKVTIVNHRSEMGQGAFQTGPADHNRRGELEVDLNNVNIIFRIRQCKTIRQPAHRRQLYGCAGHISICLRVGASAREVLIEAAAKKWNVNKTECYAENGQSYTQTRRQEISLWRVGAGSRQTHASEKKLP